MVDIHLDPEHETTVAPGLDRLSIKQFGGTS
jgi:hypothetical protein